MNRELKLERRFDSNLIKSKEYQDYKNSLAKYEVMLASASNPDGEQFQLAKENINAAREKLDRLIRDHIKHTYFENSLWYKLLPTRGERVYSGEALVIAATIPLTLMCLILRFLGKI